ncbi:Protein of unknown function, partial [Cotesia congregata]
CFIKGMGMTGVFKWFRRGLSLELPVQQSLRRGFEPWQSQFFCDFQGLLPCRLYPGQVSVVSSVTVLRVGHRQMRVQTVRRPQPRIGG